MTQHVFDLVLARGVLTAGGEHSGLVHLWWRAEGLGERAVQVYVDGELVEVMDRPGARETWLMLDRTRRRRIELLAVDVADGDGVWRQHREALGSWGPAVAGELELAVMRDERLAVDTAMSVKVDGELRDGGLMWPADEHRGGFGALFGQGAFGRDDATGLGLGAGELGIGQLGADGRAWRWRRDDVGVGEHELVLEARGESGAERARSMMMTKEVEALPGEAKGFGIDGGWVASWG